MLKVENLYSGYEKMEIIKGISLEVGKREIVAIIGPNGSGKSTFLKTIFGTAKIFKGRIYFNGEDITKLKPSEVVARGISYVPQTDNVFLNLTVMENLELGAYLRKNYEKIEDVFDIFPVLKEKRKEKALNLSGGERQMLAIARALIQEPKLLLLDEPSAGLAPKLVGEVLEKISEIKNLGLSVVLVEQNVKKALGIADRVCVFVGGKKVYEGSPEELSKVDISKLFFGVD